MCHKLEISRAAYYKWLHREVSVSEQTNIKLATLIIDYHQRFGGILGYRRMTSWINYFNSTSYKPKHVHHLMKKLDIKSCIRCKRKKYQRSTAETVAENILKRDFLADAPNEKWLTDVTELKIPGNTTHRKLYISAILDLYDLYPVAYVISYRNDNELVFKTFKQAIAANPGATPLFHSDRGFQYTSPCFKQLLAAQGMTQSMSRVGHCIDNGPMEGFWGILKTEMPKMFPFSDEKSLRHALDCYMKFYTDERLQARFNHQTPKVVREAALKSVKPIVYPIPENKRIADYKAKWSA